MNIDKSRFAISMARAVRDVEDRTDHLLSGCAEMLQQFVDGRRASKLAAHVGQEALEHFTRYVHQTAQARGALIAAHDAMETEGLRLGMVFDPLEGKPKGGSTEPMTPAPALTA